MKIYRRHWFYFWFTILTAIGAISVLMDGDASALGGLAVIAIINFLLYRTSYIKIDGDIVEGRVGILKVQKLNSNKKNISSVKVEKGVIGRILGFGKIYIDTASSAYCFSMMKNPDEIQREILK